MRVKLLDSASIDDADIESKLQQLSENGLIRREFMKYAAGVMLGFMAPFCLINKQAEANRGLITLGLLAIELIRDMWGVKEPTSGKLTLVNNYQFVREGPIFMYVNGRGREGYTYFDHSVPPRTMNTYEFYDGPCGFYPGGKLLRAESSIDMRQTNMVVNV